jgi:uncharacterized protein (TIGR00730 family)
MKTFRALVCSSLLSCLPIIGRTAELVASGQTPRSWVAERLSVCVYCGASDLADAKYAEAARQVGMELARRQWTLVWGGSKTGLMGAVARGAKEAGGRVVGVLPEFIRDWEVAYDRADELMVVTTMHERKMLLQARADAFVILPGGIGTLDELGDTLDLRNLGKHRKPIILLNQDGYYDSLLAFVDHSIAEKFSKTEARGQLRVVRTVDEAIAVLGEIERDSPGSDRPRR